MRAQFLPFHVPEIGDENVGTSVRFIPLHLHPFHRDAFTYRPKDFPNASTVYDRQRLPAVIKRTFDIVAATVGLVVLSPCCCRPAYQLRSLLQGLSASGRSAKMPDSSPLRAVEAVNFGILP